MRGPRTQAALLVRVPSTRRLEPQPSSVLCGMGPTFFSLWAVLHLELVL